MTLKGNYSSILVTTLQSKNPWIIDSFASDHTTNTYQLFTTYTPCLGNLKVRVVYGILSTIVGKRNIQISYSMSRINSLFSKSVL